MHKRSFQFDSSRTRLRRGSLPHAIRHGFF